MIPALLDLAAYLNGEPRPVERLVSSEELRALERESMTEHSAHVFHAACAIIDGLFDDGTPS